VRRDNQVVVVEPIDVPNDVSLNPVHVRNTDLSGDFLLVTLKPLTDVTTAVGQVRNAFLAAAAVGLLVAVLLGIGLATGIGRRLARLRAAAVRVAAEGTDAPTPRDDGSTRSATSPGRWPPCSASCAARNSRAAPSSPRRPTSCARR
jgi:hypothetical protein